jgi:hypothetical protein
MVRLLVLASIVLSSAMLTAQVERVTVRMAPGPNQTLHLRTTEDMALTTEGDVHDGNVGAMPPMAMNMRMVVDTTCAVGPTDHDGHYTAKTTIDSLSATMTLNGREMPFPSPKTALARQVITFSYDEQGKVIDISTDDVASARMDAARQILASAFATVAPMTLSVGESVTVPTALNLPLPSGGPAFPMGVAGATRYTLTSVTFDGADRIAHLTSHLTSTLTPGSAGAPAGSSAGPPFTFDMTVTGAGKNDVNVDRGIVLHSEQQGTIDGTLRGGPVGAAGPVISQMRLRGTFTIVSDLVK